MNPSLSPCCVITIIHPGTNLVLSTPGLDLGGLHLKAGLSSFHPYVAGTSGTDEPTESGYSHPPDMILPPTVEKPSNIVSLVLTNLQVITFSEKLINSIPEDPVFVNSGIVGNSNKYFNLILTRSRTN